MLLPKVRRRAGYQYFLGNKLADDGTSDSTPNETVHNLYKTIRSIVAPTAEAETGGLYLNVQEVVPIRTVLEGMGHL